MEIFKVQISLFTNQPVKQAVIYNFDRSIIGTFDADKTLLKFMKGSPKKYVIGKIVDGHLVIKKEALPQDW